MATLGRVPAVRPPGPLHGPRCAAQRARGGNVGRSYGVPVLLRKAHARVERWYGAPAGWFQLDSTEGAWLRTWSAAVLVRRLWNLRVCVDLVLTALLLQLEFALLAAAARGRPDLEPLRGTTRALATYFAHQERSAADAGLDRSSWQFPVGEARVLEAAARYLRLLKRMAGEEVKDNCGCYHQGWDYYIGLRGTDAVGLLGRPDLPARLSDNGSYEAQVVLQQHCAGETWTTWQLDASEALARAALGTLCVQGDVALLLLCSTQALLRGKLGEALASLDYAAAFAPLMMDCLPSHQWPFGAEDVLYNAGRLAWQSQIPQFVPQRFDVKALAWRPRTAPSAPRPWEAAQLRALGFIGGRHLRAKCTMELENVCFQDGRLSLYGALPLFADLGGPAAGGTQKVHLPFCSDYGVSWASAWHNERSTNFPWDNSSGTSGFVAWFLPVATLYNPEHALHWLLPAFARSRGFRANGSYGLARVPLDVELLIFFDGRGTIPGENRRQAWMAEFFHLLSDREPVFLNRAGGTRHCWRRMLWGAGDFNLRHSPYNELDPKLFGRLELAIRRHSVFAGRDTLPAVAPSAVVRWRCVSTCADAEPEVWVTRQTNINVTCGACACCQHRAIAQPQAEPRLNVLVVQRSATIGRHITNLAGVLEVIQSSQPPVLDITVLAPSDATGGDAAGGARVADHSHLWHPVSQVLAMPRFDLVVGAYGGALAFSAFMHEGTVIELFPVLPASSVLLCAPGWDANAQTVYGGLAWQSGQRHACLASSAPPPGVGGRAARGSGGAEGEGLLWRELPIQVDLDRFGLLAAEAVVDLFRRRYGIELQVSP